MEDLLIIIGYVVIGIIVFKVLKYLLALILGLGLPLNISGRFHLIKLLKKNGIDINILGDGFLKEMTERVISISSMTAYSPNKYLNTEFLKNIEWYSLELAKLITGNKAPEKDDWLYELLIKYNIEIASGNDRDKMFFKKKKATKAAIEAVEAVLMLMKLKGIPEGFWHDPFVLGYFGTVISSFGKIAVNDKLTAEDLGNIQMDVLEHFSGIPGIEVGKSVIDYMTNQNEDFMLGIENATKCILMMGPPTEKLLNDPDVLKARKLASDPNLQSITSGSILGALTYLLFYCVIKKRFWDK